MADHVDNATVRHVAKLARIRINDDEVSAIADHLTKILDYVAVLNEVDPSSVEPENLSLRSVASLRADVACASWSSERALENTPDKHAGFIRVPKVLDQGST